MAYNSFSFILALLEYLGNLSKFMQVAAVGNTFSRQSTFTLCIAKLGAKDLKPSKGAREQEVENRRKRPRSSAEKVKKNRETDETIMTRGR